MRLEDKIGKKVWLLDGSLGFGFHLKSKDTFTVKEVKLGLECRDWANHYVIEHDSDGHTIEVREYEVIFAPEGDSIYQYLADNDVYSDVYENSEGVVSVEISWGDWKHEHLWCRDLMQYIGYIETDSRVTEDDGSDTYSAIHYFVKAA